MHNQPKESDWKHFKTLYDVALQRIAQQALDAIQKIASDDARTSHERYLKIFKAMEKWDRKISRGFDGFSRSKMLFQVAHMRKLQLINDDEFAGFSSDLQDFAERFGG